MAKTKMFKFNVKNVKYAVPEGINGLYGVPKDLAYANSISLEADYDETKLYGDGQILTILGDDKGKTGTLSVINIEKGYEIDMKRALEIDTGLADIQQRSSVEHAIYFEVDAIEDGVAKTIKRWMFGVTTGKASETFEQTQDDPTINTYEYPLTVLGTYLLDDAGNAPYTDENGNTIKVYHVTCFPDDDGYEGFEEAVPEPKVKAGN